MPSFFITFPTKADNIEDIVSNRRDAESFVKELLMTLDRIDCENNAQIFINKENIENFINDYKTLEKLLEIKIGAYNLEDALRSFITHNSIKIISKKDYVFDYYFKLNCFFQIDEIFNCRNQHRQLNRNDFRHCENHPKRISSKSPLIGGLGGFDNAEKLLPSAIGDVRTNRSVLINTDKINQNFIIRFEDENFNNQFHVYHIVKNIANNYMEDSEKLNQIKNSHKGIPRAYKLITYRNERSKKVI
ncbi:MAG: hypothetical protein IPO21_10180 [Bacteroidales bacterium]|nr:hypothetical protein [Bacteroidales bacterium]